MVAAAQHVAEPRDRAQRRAQVVSHRVGKTLDLRVGRLQLRGSAVKVLVELLDATLDLTALGDIASRHDQVLVQRDDADVDEPDGERGPSRPGGGNQVFDPVRLAGDGHLTIGRESLAVGEPGREGGSSAAEDLLAAKADQGPVGVTYS